MLRQNSPPSTLPWFLAIRVSNIFKKFFIVMRTFSKSDLIYLFLAILGPCCCSGFSLVAASRGYSLAVGHGLLLVVASLVAERGLKGKQTSAAVAPGL